MNKLLPSLLLLLASVAIYGYRPIKQRLVTLGVTRSRGSISNLHGSQLRTIQNTRDCEDLHYWPASGLLYTACEGESSPRTPWFPPMAVFDEPPAETGSSTGSLFVIDPATFTSTRLRLDGFSGSFVTHGIDIVADPLDENAIYIHAINHLPHPDTSGADQARSQVEIFHHRLHTTSARHIRSVRHPLIRLPNDLLGLGPGEFYVTNDHKHREGFLRTLEDIWTGRMSHNTETVHVRADVEGEDGATGVSARVALDGMHNNNGLGRGANKDEIIICDAAGGVVHLAQIPAVPSAEPLKVIDSIQMDTTIDNPSYFRDPYSTHSCDTSGYMIPGLVRGIDYGPHFRNASHTHPSIVWHLSRSIDGSWDRRVVFRDDGETLSSASTAVLLPIDPLTNANRKEAWLWVTGPSSRAAVATKIDLAALCQ